MSDFLLINQLLDNKLPKSNNIDCADFITANQNINAYKREDNIYSSLVNGGMPEFLRFFKPIEIKKDNTTFVYFVSSDYLAIGNNDLYMRIPMLPKTAQKICDEFDCSLPTPKMVKQIWEQSVNKLMPTSMPSYDMASTQKYKDHSKTIDQQLKNLDKFELTSGHKKDIVLTNQLRNPNNRIAIYGWFYPNGQFIQGLNATSHDVNYVDYSHGVRLVSNTCYLNGEEVRLQDIFKDPGNLINDGILNFLSY